MRTPATILSAITLAIVLLGGYLILTNTNLINGRVEALSGAIGRDSIRGDFYDDLRTQATRHDEVLAAIDHLQAAVDKLATAVSNDDKSITDDLATIQAQLQDLCSAVRC